jgi:hypothetical protein
MLPRPVEEPVVSAPNQNPSIYQAIHTQLSLEHVKDAPAEGEEGFTLYKIAGSW